MPVCVCGGEEEAAPEGEEAGERMAWRRSFHRAWALLDRGGDRAVMLGSGRAAACAFVLSGVKWSGGRRLFT